MTICWFSDYICFILHIGVLTTWCSRRSRRQWMHHRASALRAQTWSLIRTMRSDRNTAKSAGVQRFWTSLKHAEVQTELIRIDRSPYIGSDMVEICLNMCNQPQSNPATRGSWRSWGLPEEYLAKSSFVSSTDAWQHPGHLVVVICGMYVVMFQECSYYFLFPRGFDFWW